MMNCNTLLSELFNNYLLTKCKYLITCYGQKKVGQDDEGQENSRSRRNPQRGTDGWLSSKARIVTEDVQRVLDIGVEQGDAVSYTHLDVYKRQVCVCVCVCVFCFSMRLCVWIGEHILYSSDV